MSARQFGFMTRRLRPGEGPTPSAAAEGTSAGLRLDGAGPLRAPAPAEVRSLPSLPVARGEVILTDATPVVRLSAYASGIGSLQITGAQQAAWETVDRATGVVGSGATLPRPGNRSLVERLGDELIVGLRHVQLLRRLVIAGTDTTIFTSTGTKVFSPGPTTTAIAVIDGRIEIRREPASADLATDYSIGEQP